MPSSLRWAAQRPIHFWANSVSAGRRGRKLAEKAFLRPAVLVPTIRSVGISMMPRSTRPAIMASSKISSSTCG